MAVKFETVKAGDVLYDVHRTKMGNTTMSRLGWWRVEVISVAEDGKSVMARWDYNAPKTMYRSQIEKLRRSIPKKLAGPGGNVRP